MYFVTAKGELFGSSFEMLGADIDLGLLIRPLERRRDQLHQVIHEHGVAPTILAPMSLDQERALILQRREDLPDEQRKKDLANFRDTQLDRAVDALKGVLVYAQRAGGK